MRDLLLGLPVADIDIATSARPDQVAELFPETLEVGKSFGVMIVVQDDMQFEVATFRKDLEYEDGRHPSGVRFTDAQEDARRRDFTVNALFLDPLSGEVIDYVGGQRDLQKGLIRCVGTADERFREDRLRVLRAVRFSCQLGFEIQEETREAIAKWAPQITTVSWERIRDEILRIFTGSRPAEGLDLLNETGLLHEILPEVESMIGVEQPPEFHPEGDVFVHTRLMFELSNDRSESLAIGILLHDVGKPPTFTVKERIRFDGHTEVGAEMAEDICRRLRLSKDATARIVDLVRNHLRFMHVREMRESTLKRFLRKENFHEHLELHRLDCLASHGDLSAYYFCLEKLEEFSKEAMKPEPLLGGRDLIALGLEPGPIFSEILEPVEDRQLEGRLKTREEALQWVRENYEQAG